MHAWELYYYSYTSDYDDDCAGRAQGRKCISYSEVRTIEDE